MKCPVDNAVLQITSREGIEIDYCPDCRGVWLDRGELDKIIERGGDFSRQSPTVTQRSADDHNYHNESRHSHDYRKKHKKSFLDDIFDF